MRKSWPTSINQCVILQFSSVAQSCPTLCDPMNRSTPGLHVHHQLPEFTQIHVHRVHDAIQPSHPRSSPSPTAPNPSQHQSLCRFRKTQMRNQKEKWRQKWVTLSFSLFFHDNLIWLLFIIVIGFSLSILMFLAIHSAIKKFFIYWVLTLWRTAEFFLSLSLPQYLAWETGKYCQYGQIRNLIWDKNTRQHLLAH